MIKYFYKKKQKKPIFLYNNQQRGFSLIEMMVVVVILGVIVLGLVTFFTGGAKSWVAGQSQLEAQRNARQAMDRMVREIREGSSFNSSDDSTITISYPSSFEKNPVTYSLINTTISRDGSPLINDVKTLKFTPTHVPKVHILLEVDVDKDGNPDISLNADVKLRNFEL